MFVVASTPVLSQLFGCTPVGPIGWGQALFAATAASTLAATAPGLLDRVVNGARSVVDNLDDADTNEDGVEVAERRGQYSNGAAEQRVLPETAKETTHDSAK